MKPAKNYASALFCAAAFTFLLLADPAPAAASPGGRAAPSNVVRFLVHFPLRRTAELEALIENQTTRTSPLFHHFLTSAQFQSAYGAAPQTLLRATAMLAARGLLVTARTSQFLFVRGSNAAVERAFAAHQGLRVPDELAQLGATVHGLDAVPRPQSNARRIPQSLSGPFGAYWFDDLKEAYAFPAYAAGSGAGVSIATVGNSDFSDTDVKLYFQHEKLGSAPGDLAPAPVPQHFNLAGFAPFDPASRDSFEANLDVQQANGSAPRATVTNVAAPASAGEGFLYAYSVIDESNFASIVSTSYGGCELLYTAAYNAGRDLTGVLRAYHDLFLQGNSQGITFIFSSGDRGGRECAPPAYYNRGPGLRLASIPSVQYWADDPNVTSVGGTDLATSYASGSRRSDYSYETAYADPLLPEDPAGTGNLLMHDVFGSGGGESAIWPKPKYQTLVDTRTVGRAVPDIAMEMGSCPGGAVQPCHPGASATVEAFGGAFVGAIGTSIAAPEFAGLVAIAEQAQGGARLGNINPLIYTYARANGTPALPFYHQYIPGNNGIVNDNAVLAYNLITGVGTPIARNWALLPFAARAGDPQTSSNP